MRAAPLADPYTGGRSAEETLIYMQRAAWRADLYYGHHTN